jgi:hypothetical protein
MTALAPKGIGAILTRGDGEVLCHSFDFELASYGGFKLWEAQRIRARNGCCRKFIQQWTYGDVASVLETYDAEKIVDSLCRDKGYRMTFVSIGHEIDDKELNR